MIHCTKCKQSYETILVFALLKDAGSKVFPDPRSCPAGGKHEFAQDAAALAAPPSGDAARAPASPKETP